MWDKQTHTHTKDVGTGTQDRMYENRHNQGRKEDILRHSAFQLQ